MNAEECAVMQNSPQKYFPKKDLQEVWSNYTSDRSKKNRSKEKNTWQRAINIASWVSLILCGILAVWGYQSGIFQSVETMQQFVNRFGMIGALIFVLNQSVQVVFPIIPGGISCLAGVLLFFGINAVMQRMGRKESERKVACDTELVNQIMEYIQGISEVKSYNLIGKQTRRLNAANEASAETNIKMEMGFVPFHFLQSTVTKLTSAAVIAMSAYFYVHGTMDMIYAIGMSVSAFLLYASLESAGTYSSLLHVVSVCVDKANEILELDTMDIDDFIFGEEEKSSSER